MGIDLYVGILWCTKFMVTDEPEVCTVMHLGKFPPISPSVSYIAIILIVKWKVFAINYKNDENSVLKMVDVMCLCCRKSLADSSNWFKWYIYMIFETVPCNWFGINLVIPTILCETLN